MKKRHRVNLKRNIKEFSFSFVKEISSLIQLLRDCNLSVREFLPNIFLEEKISVKAVYSLDKEYVLVILNKHDEPEFSFDLVRGDVFGFLDPTGTWDKWPAAIRVGGSSRVNIDTCTLTGCRPFEMVGNEVEIYLNNLSLNIPYKGTIVIPYALIMSYSVFIERSKYVQDFARDIIHGYVNYANQYGKGLDAQSLEVKNYEESLEDLKAKMKSLFFDETVLEHSIDKFLQENPVILKQCLNLTNLLSQIELKDTCSKYGQNLKPDLIGFDEAQKQWTIVDYKRAKRNIIKNCDTVRASFKAEVTELQAQLRDYKEYFEEETYRCFFKEEYGHLIEFPKTVGIIGRIPSNQEREFNRQREDLPRWFEIIPYNYLYDRYCRFVDTVKRLPSVK